MPNNTALYSCWPGRESVLAAELSRQNMAAKPIAEGWVQATQTPGHAPIASFANQVWPHPEPIEAASIQAWAAALVKTLSERIDKQPWRLHLFHQESQDRQVTPRRLALIGEALIALLKQKQRRLLKTLQHDDFAPWDAQESLVQVAVMTRTEGFVSIVHADERPRWQHILSRFPGGVVHPEEDKRPPARAYLKLREAVLHLGAAPQAGDTCVDLGAAPGSWTYDALDAGARVMGLDRSPLRDDIMAHPNFTFVRADAFKFAPEAPVDWLLCDVIAFPQRSIELIETWLAKRWCRRFVVTLKFRGDDDYAIVDACKNVLRKSGATFGMRQLFNNKNEVTVYGALDAK